MIWSERVSLILPRNSGQINKGGVGPAHPGGGQHGAITTRLCAGSHARGREPGDRWRASHRPGRAGSRDHAESVTAQDASGHRRSRRRLPRQGAAQASRRGAHPLHAGVGRGEARAGFLKKCGGVLRQAVGMRCRAIRAHVGRVPWRLLAVSPRATLPGWLGRSVSARLRIDGWSPRSGLSTQRREGPRAVLGVTQPFRPRPSGSEYPGGLAQTYPVVRNTLNRKFAVAAPNRVWTGAITYVWTTEGWLDLAVVLDLSARRVLAWGMGSRLTQALAMAALTMAVTHRRPAPGGEHPTDRGAPSAATRYRGCWPDTV